MDVVVFTSDKHLWAVKPFSVLFQKYWSSDQRVIVVGYNMPDFDLPQNFVFYSISQTEYPADKWVDGTLEFLADYTAETFVLFHEDYWLTRKVDIEAVNDLDQFLRSDPNVFRVDLTGDRLYAGGMRDVGGYKRYDLIEAPDSQYQMSHQATIVKTEGYVKMLRSFRDDQHSAWAVELEGTTFINNYGARMRVIGTRQWPVRYANALLKGKLDWNELPKLSNSDYELVEQFIPDRYKG